jgi:hypothetical protein
MVFGRAVAWWTGVDVVLSPLGFLPAMGIRRQGPVTLDHDREGTSTWSLVGHLMCQPKLHAPCL